MKNIARKALAMVLAALTIMTSICGSGVGAIKAQAADGVEINEENFPDEAFRNFVNIYDRDNDDVLSEEEIKWITELGSLYTYGVRGLTDLTGIKYFKNLKSISIHGYYKISELDVSGLTNLEELRVTNVGLEKLNAEGCSNLKKLDCFNNSLKELNLKGCDKLEEFKAGLNPLVVLEPNESVDLRDIFNWTGAPDDLELGSFNKDAVSAEGTVITAHEITEWTGDYRSADIVTKEKEEEYYRLLEEEGSFGIDVNVYVTVYVVKDKSNIKAEVAGLDINNLEDYTWTFPHPSAGEQGQAYVSWTIPTVAYYYDDMTVSKWKSSDSKSVSVDQNGIVTAIKPVQGDTDSTEPGSVTIYAYLKNGIVAEREVTTYFKDVEHTYTLEPSHPYYYEPVYWAFNNGITTGKHGGQTFAPTETCTRGQIVTFLWRLAGEPEPTVENPFKDIKSSAYYYKAVLWAYENGITTGRRGGKTFDPNGTCTRREIVTFLWRYAGKPTPSSTGKFTDVTDSSAYYYNAIYWAVEQGITTGKSATGGTTFDPTGLCTRAMAVTFIYRYANN